METSIFKLQVVSVLRYKNDGDPLPNYDKACLSISGVYTAGTTSQKLLEYLKSTNGSVVTVIFDKQ